MGIMGEICSAINEIDGKKQKLRESLKHLLLVLQSNSSDSVARNLKWEDLDSYLKKLESSLQTKYNLLLRHQSPVEERSTELKRLCENSDGLGLKQFVVTITSSESESAPADPLSILVEAFTRYAPHTAPAMVLDSISLDQFHPSSPLVIMLQALIRFMQNQPPEPADIESLKDKAMQVALQLRTCSSSSLGFLLLVKAYGLIHRFDNHLVIDSFIILAQTLPSHAIHLCPQLLTPNHINDLIQKLIDKGMHITAVNFSLQLHTTDRFPPVRLLEERKLMSTTAIEEALHDVEACNEVMLREIGTLKAIIKCVDENHLHTEYPKDSVVELVNKLENEAENAKQHLVKKLRNDDPGSKKRPAIARVSKKKLLSKTKKPKQDKFLQTAASAEPQNAMPAEEPHSQASDLLTGHIDQYHSSSCGSDPTAPYTAPASPCELARANSGHSGNLMPVDKETGLCVSQSHPPSCYNSNGWISE
uniref:FRIGIDA-like protein 1 n=1 Tax=Erigeron canadensis TaxID=72917 RepID=UPI001CB8CA5C|nr:FRIGIDA-like protein 1 [Erigeron canadensis]